MAQNIRNDEHDIDEAKREFMIKYGKFAATAPLGMYLLMGPGASKAQASGSCGRPGHGRPGHGRPGHGRPGHGRPGHGRPGHGGRHGP